MIMVRATEVKIAFNNRNLQMDWYLFIYSLSIFWTWQNVQISVIWVNRGNRIKYERIVLHLFYFVNFENATNLPVVKIVMHTILAMKNLCNESFLTSSTYSPSKIPYCGGAVANIVMVTIVHKMQKISFKQMKPINTHFNSFAWFFR